MAVLPGYDLAQARRAFPLCDRLTYLNHASISPIPLPAQDMMNRVNDWLVNDPQALFNPSPDSAFGDIFATFMSEVARLINAADIYEIVNITSTSAGLNAAAQSLPWQPGDNVVLVNVEFPSNVYPWMALERFGVECRFAAPDQGGASVETIAPLVDARTRLIAVSAIQFLTGHRADLTAIGTFCRERGILFAVDAIQAAGHMPIDVQAIHIDILSAGGQKSLMGPPGQGFLYVRRELSEQMQPGQIGPNAVKNWMHWVNYDPTPREGALRLMMGTPNVAGMIGLVESIRFLRGLGLAHIAAWTSHLSQIALERLAARGDDLLTPTDPAHLGPIVTFRVGDRSDPARADADANALVSYLHAQHVRVMKHWDKQRWPYLRISSHCYNSEQDIIRLFDLLGEYRS